MNSQVLNLNPEQLTFVQRTYRILFVTLCLMTVVGIFSYNVLPPVAKFPILILDMLIWVACGWFGWRNPIKTVFPLFLVITGLALGQIAHFYRPEMFLTAALLTLAIFAGVSSYVLSSKRDFSFLRVGLNLCFWVILAMGILLFFVDISVLSLLFGLFGTAVFIGWILYDTSQLLYRIDDSGYSPYLGAFDLFMDMIGLFSFIRQLLNYFDD